MMNGNPKNEILVKSPPATKDNPKLKRAKMNTILFSGDELNSDLEVVVSNNNAPYEVKIDINQITIDSGLIKTCLM